MKKLSQIIIFLFFGIGFNNLSAQIIKENHIDKTFTVDPQVKYGKLANGFTYYIQKNDAPVNSIEMRLVVKAGMLYEEKDQLGLAHLMEHMCVKGLKHFPDGFWEYLKKQGINVNESANPYTASLYTCYELGIPSAKQGLLDSSLLILKDWCHGFLLKESEIDEERGAIIREVDSKKGNYTKLEAQLLRHPKYAANNLDRIINNYKKFDYSSLKRFYEKWYRPDRQCAIIVGDVNVDEIENKIKKLFSDIPNPLNSVKDPVFTSWAVQPDGKNNFIKVEDSSVSEIQFQLYTKASAQIPYLQKKTPNQYRLELKERLYKEMTSFRFGTLPESIPFSLLSTSIDREVFNRDAQLESFSILIRFSASQSVKTAFQAAMLEFEKIRRYGFEEEELLNAKQKIKKSFTHSISSKNFAGKYLNHFVYGTPALAPEYELALSNKTMGEITLKEMDQFVKEWMDRIGNKDIVVKGPENKLFLFTEDSIEHWMAEVSKMKIKGDKSIKTANNTFESIQWPSSNPDAIVEEKSIATIGVKQIKLENGVTVILKPFKPTDQQNSQILLEGYAPGGYSVYNGADYDTALTAIAVIKRNGLGGMSVIDMKKWLWGKDIQVFPNIREQERGIYGSADAESFKTLLQLVYLYLTSPNKATGSEKAYAIYKECFSDFSKFLFVITGDFNIQDHQAIIVKYLGALPSLNNEERHANLEQNLPTANGVFSSIKKNTQTSASVELSFTGRYNYSESTNVRLKLLATLLQIALEKRLRGREGATYFVSSDANYSRKDSYEFKIAFETEADRAEKMAGVVLEEIEKIKSGGVDPGIFQQAASQEITTNEMNSLGNWRNYLMEQYKHEEDPEAMVYRKAMLTTITPEELQNVAIALLNTNNFINSKH